LIRPEPGEDLLRELLSFVCELLPSCHDRSVTSATDNSL
jgi:hypothetical protein